LGLPELAGDERYNSVRKRADLAAEIVPRLHAALAFRTALEWEKFFGDAVPCAAARNIEDVFRNEQVLAEKMVTTFNHPLVGQYRGQTRPIKFGRTPGPPAFAAPTFGQHSDRILEEFGFSPQARQELRDKGVVK
jgi:formyl-CoA transferase